MKVLTKPITRQELDAAPIINEEGYKAFIVDVSLSEFVGSGVDSDGFEDMLCARVLGRNCGIVDLDYHVVGHLGDTLYLNVSGLIDPDIFNPHDDNGGQDFAPEILPPYNVIMAQNSPDTLQQANNKLKFPRTIEEETVFDYCSIDCCRADHWSEDWIANSAPLKEETTCDFCGLTIFPE